MLKVLSFAAVLLSLFFIACGDESTSESENKTVLKKAPVYDTMKTGVIIDMKGRDEPALAYSLYLPTGYVPSNKVPLVVLLDAHSRTHTSIKQYISVCEKLHVAMICSGNSRNGLESSMTNSIVQKTLDDVMLRVHADSSKLYLAGFSGGARVASAAAMADNRVKGVVACAAGIDQSVSPAGINIPYVLIAGVKDMNSTELYQLYTSIKSPHGFMLFNGIHEWAPDSIMFKAVQGLLNNSVEKLTDVNKLNGIFTKTMLDNDNLQRSQLQQLFQNNAWDEILKRVTAMKTLSQTEIHPDAKAMQQRLLSVCGMYCFFTVPKAPDINKALLVYETTDPTNPDLWFFKAVNAAKTDKAKAKAYLTKAADLGFYDMQRVTQEPALRDVTDDALIKKINSNN